MAHYWPQISVIVLLVVNEAFAVHKGRDTAIAAGAGNLIIVALLWAGGFFA